ncbi:hypothetical protein Aspvir_001189 [Aspergillus viridinutans]|uniref:F-box domain-containing protein n=1 Tax=Aspergillus viridinutans TaxID=75553 RepID=A0A9P3F2G6_ASPVI|nr:uncharacterized protein Aspvir_001189 [Aspergillus viridinutans]GIJ99065.1 hypothetical protein Aspvir_001189 [Aspergillus viridinutans]
MSLADNLAQVVSLGQTASENVNHDGNAVRTAKRSTREVLVAPTKKPLHLLDLPMDVLQDIIKEVTHTNDLTSLALTCSALHALAIPQMYSRFDIVWPDTLSSSDHPAGVDALSYGLATLVMGEDLFHETPSAGRSPFSMRESAQAPTQQRTMWHMRRGNYYAQYTRKFSVGNGPLAWVQEYAVTKETGKMLGTLVALAVARMVNLETFIWDMPTGVVRDVWMALSSLANRPGRDCRLERVWVRWHDNTENAMRPTSGLLPSASVSPLVRYSHVEYPSLSILPPLKSLSVLDIDEPSYLEEMAVLIDRSRDRLTELRIGISSRVYQCDWLKPRSAPSAQEDASDDLAHNWPKAGGVLEILSGKWQDYLGHRETSVQPSPIKKGSEQEAPLFTGEQVMSHNELIETISDGDSTSSESHSPNHLTGNKVAASTTRRAVPERSDKLPSASCYSTSRTETASDRILRLEILELERVFICIPVILQVIDWTRVTTLTILRCDGHEKLWRALRRQYAPSAFRNTPNYAKNQDDQASQSEYPLRIKHIHTDSVSPYLLLFIKDAIARNTLETIFLHEAPLYDSIVHIEAIYRNIIRAHRLSLKKILIDSTERSPNGTEVGTSRWRKWMFTRRMISFITSGRMSKLRELSMTINSKDWHYFLQRLPYIPHLRALHIPHIANPVHRSPKELGLQILDIVTIRPEVGIGYIGIQSKCYEIVESKHGDKDDDLDDTDDNHSEGFVPGGGPWPASDMNESEDEDGMDSVMESSSELSDYGTSSDDESSSDCTRSRTTFRLREILFYDDKIAIFKARHGVL